LLCTDLKNVVGTKRIVSSYGNAHRTIHARKLFNGDDVFHIAKAGPPKLGGKDGAHHAHLAQLFDDLDGKMTILVPLHHVGKHFPFGEFAERFLELLLFFGELKVQNCLLTSEPQIVNDLGCSAAMAVRRCPEGKKPHFGQNIRLWHSHLGVGCAAVKLSRLPSPIRKYSKKSRGRTD